MEILTEREARALLKRVNLPLSSNKAILLAAASKSRRQEILLDPDHEDQNTAAAIEIQRVWRGYWTRCHLLETQNPELTNEAQPDQFSYQASDTGPQSLLSGSSSHSSPNFILRGSTSPSIGSPSPVRPSRSTSKLRKSYRKWLEENEPISFEEYCSLVAHSMWQEQHSRDIPSVRPSTMVENYSSSGKSSRNYSPFLSVQYDDQERIAGCGSPKSVQFESSSPSRPSNHSSILTRNDAASMIQKVWRRHVDVQVFQYYRDLISFKARGDPSLLLRCINPREAELLDSASGTHVKFRLAGRKFPPNIYYKIFTHRPVVDLCANSPKDYTKAATKRLNARQCHNKDQPISNGDENDGWYQRWENNGWRLVSDRILKRIDEDAVVYDTAQKKMSFKHCRLLRKQDVEMKRRKKKIEWMKKMYHEGLLHSKRGTESRLEDNIEQSLKEMTMTVDRHGPGAVEDWEVDELLEWTNGLNFDSYVSGWKESGTSAISDPLAEKQQFFLNDRHQMTIT